jgi:nicotinamide riboside kinase
MRIAVIGPHSTGKTTFIQDFVTAFPQYTTPSKTYRDAVLEKGLPINQKTGDQSQGNLLTFLYDQTTTTEGANVIFDRCVIDNYVYSYCGYLKGNISSELLVVTKRKMYDSLAHLDCLLFIPTAACVPLTEDNFRDIDLEYTDLINKTFIEVLFEISSKTHIPIYVVTGNREERIKHMREKLFS